MTEEQHVGTNTSCLSYRSACLAEVSVKRKLTTMLVNTCETLKVSFQEHYKMTLGTAQERTSSPNTLTITLLVVLHLIA